MMLTILVHCNIYKIRRGWAHRGKRYNNQSARNDLALVEEIRGEYCKLRVKLLFDIAVRKTWKCQRSKEGDL